MFDLDDNIGWHRHQIELLKRVIGSAMPSWRNKHLHDLLARYERTLESLLTQKKSSSLKAG